MLNDVATYVRFHLYSILKAAELYREKTDQWLPGLGVVATTEGSLVEGDRTLLHLDCGSSLTTMFVKLAGFHSIRVNFTECKLYLNLKLKKM